MSCSARPSSYYRLIEIVSFPPGCLPDAVPFALTSASKSLKLCTHLSPPALPPSSPRTQKLNLATPFSSHRSCHTSLLISGWSRQISSNWEKNLVFFPLQISHSSFHVAFSRPLESTSSKGSKLTTALVASHFVLRHIVSPRRPRDTLNNIPPPAGVDSRVYVRCSSF